MPLNVLGGNKVYTVPEIDSLLKNVAGFAIVDKLPKIETANAKLVYYKRTKDKMQEITGYANPDDPTDISEEPDETHTEPIITEHPLLVPYIIGKDADNNKVWYTTGGSAKDHDAIPEETILEIWNKIRYAHTTLKAGKHLALKEGQ